jgi:hypothetical protein
MHGEGKRRQCSHLDVCQNFKATFLRFRRVSVRSDVHKKRCLPQLPHLQPLRLDGIPAARNSGQMQRATGITTKK